MAVVANANSEPLIRNDETMKYRPLGRTGFTVSALSFGCMRLADDPPLNEKLLSRAIELGVNYFETTRFYLSGTCQHRTAPGVKGKTARVIVSARAAWARTPPPTLSAKRSNCSSTSSALRTSSSTRSVGSSGRISRICSGEAARSRPCAGRRTRASSSTSASPDTICRRSDQDGGDRHLRQFHSPYNMINRAYEPAIQRAGELGVGVVAMTPVAGGVLTCPSPALREAIGVDLPTPAIALRFVLSNPNVSTACSGMNTLQMPRGERRLRREVRAPAGELPADVRRTRPPAEKAGGRFCTFCNYCAGCPARLNIPQLMEIWQHDKAFQLHDWARDALKALPEDQRPERCTLCGACESKCPNTISIRARIKDMVPAANLTVSLRTI